MKRYRIADLYVDMDTFGRTLKQAQPYEVEKTDEQADICLQADWRALQSRHPHLSMDDSEYMATGSVFVRQLLRFDGFMLHSSAVVVDGKAYLFSATSGTGKSTHTTLWCREFADRGAYILNDDKPVIRLMDDAVYAYGTPWSGKYDMSRNARVPLAGICILRRGEKNSIRPCPPKEAIFPLLEQSARSANAATSAEHLETLDKLLKRVPVWYMECNMDPEAAHVAYRAMSGEKENEK